MGTQGVCLTEVPGERTRRPTKSIPLDPSSWPSASIQADHIAGGYRFRGDTLSMLFDRPKVSRDRVFRHNRASRHPPPENIAARMHIPDAEIALPRWSDDGNLKVNPNISNGVSRETIQPSTTQRAIAQSKEDEPGYFEPLLESAERTSSKSDETRRRWWVPIWTEPSKTTEEPGVANPSSD